jgi:hypothetical protein
MKVFSGISRAACILALVAAGAGVAPAQFLLLPLPTSLTVQHPAIGGWFGEAVQLCATLTDPSCSQVALFMTLNIYADGNFVGNDSLALGGPPFGPHTTAHGQWIPTSAVDIIADYTFMLPGTAASGTTPATINALRFRWNATATSDSTMTGYVNIFFGPPIPVAWQNIKPSAVPTLPSQTVPTLTPPALFYTDPAQCPGGPAAGCPLVFKFTINRVAP